MTRDEGPRRASAEDWAKPNDWTQPICRTCYAAFSLGLGDTPHREPLRLAAHSAAEPCLICGEATRIYVRVNPKLTAGLAFAQKVRE